MSQLHQSIDPYYKEGDVFQRDERYYEQIITNTRRNKTPNKSMQGSQAYKSQGNYGHQSNITQKHQSDDSKRLREQNDLLKAELQKLTYGAQFGTGDMVVKKQYYTNSQSQNQMIREQESGIHRLQETIKMNNQRLIGYQKAANELQLRMNNIQSIDKEIYKNLKGASMRDKELLERASTALVRGESREQVTRILQQIIAS